MEASFDIVTAVCADLRVLLGKLHLLRALAESPPNWTAWAEPLARMAFDEGHYCGWAMATGQVDAVNPIEPEAAGDSSTDPARGDPSDGEQSADGAGPDHDPDTKAETDRIADLAERMAQIPAKVLDRLADDLAVELVTQWEAFGRFCRANLELEPMTLLEAWRYPTNDLTGALASYAHTKPDAARAAEYEALLGRAWEHRCLGW
jgi:hypothetical protein